MGRVLYQVDQAQRPARGLGEGIACSRATDKGQIFPLLFSVIRCCKPNSIRAWLTPLAQIRKVCRSICVDWAFGCAI